jgi:hypothetical protein
MGGDRWPTIAQNYKPDLYRQDREETKSGNCFSFFAT